jgi:Protein of unknown function (DUF2628)
MSEYSYTVYEPHQVEQDLVARADELVFVKDGFAGWAMIGSVFWMVYYRLWMPLIGFVVAFGVLVGLAYLFGASTAASGLLFLGLSVSFGFLANDIRRLVLENEDYKMIGAIAGPSKIECERRFFHNWSPLSNRLHYEETK